MAKSAARKGPKSGDRRARPLPGKRPARVRVTAVTPTIGATGHSVKRTEGEVLHVTADVIHDGHEAVGATLRWKAPGSDKWREQPMTLEDPEGEGLRWGADLLLDALGTWTWTVRAWPDRVETWRQELRRRLEAGEEDLDSVLTEGAALHRASAERAKGRDRRLLESAAADLGDGDATIGARAATALDPTVIAATTRYPDLAAAAGPPKPSTVIVDPVLARFGAWYELFPRSWGGLAGVRRRLPALAELGFDVLYLPPIHPIGRTNRKGPNNALSASESDPGSPWAIGDETGGHTAVHPDLGTIDDVDALIAEARSLDIEIALDLAIQCSADHPWLTEHPEWFFRRPDGTLKYAENPPKKYQDIYNVDFDSEAWQELWHALLDVVWFWIDHGVRVFRVDNPHTKPLPFWEWLIGSVRDERPDVVFLAEAFTRPSLMRELARIGFNQSYTYFTWKTSRWELEEYVSELAGEDADSYRPNFFVNTPDILTEQLQHGGPAAFTSRLILAATLAPSFGIYSGYEHYEGTAVRPGSEEYLDSEKYQVRDRELDGPLLPLIADLNRIRTKQPALQHIGPVTFLDTKNEQLLAYAKGRDGDAIVTVVNLDPGSPQEGAVWVPPELGLPEHFTAEDLLTGARYDWMTGDNYVRLEPGPHPAHILAVAR